MRHVPRIVVAKTSLDGHWRGITIVERALRDAGFHVIPLGMATESEIISAVIEEDADLLGLNIGGRAAIVARIQTALFEQGLQTPIFVGGVITPKTARDLKQLNIPTFPPGSPLEAIINCAQALTNAVIPGEDI